MPLAIDLLIALIVIYSAFSGTRRGAVLISLEYVSFALATGVAILFYHDAGAMLRSLGMALALANIVAFSGLWVFTEIVSSVIMRYTVLRHLNRRVQLSAPNQFGGAFLNSLKFTLIIMLSLLVFSGLPVSRATKAPVEQTAIAKYLLDTISGAQGWLSTGLGRDLGDSLNFFTISSQPESQEHINLGFTVANPATDIADEDAMLALINQERTSRGLTVLTVNAQARIAARAYSKRMFAEGYFSHIDADHKNPFDRLRAAGVEFNSAGENLALAPTLLLAHQGLMNSPGHRANILSPNYHRVGIGILDGGPYGLMVTQEFTD